MKKVVKDLGKVCVTPEGVWDINKDYERISIVYEANTNKTYISKKDVPKGTSIKNEEYWMLVVEGGAGDGTATDNSAIHSKDFSGFVYEN